MVIQTIGRSLSQILPKLPGKKINEFFDLVRPLVEFKFDAVLARANNIFEIMTVEPIDVLLRVRSMLTALHDCMFHQKYHLPGSQYDRGG